MPSTLKSLNRLALASVFSAMISAPALAAEKTFMPILPPKPPKQETPKKKPEKTFMPVLPKEKKDEVRIMPVSAEAR